MRMTKEKIFELAKKTGVPAENFIVPSRHRFPWSSLITIVPSVCGALCLYGMIENFLLRSWVETGILGTCVSACMVCVVLILKYTTRSQ